MGAGGDAERWVWGYRGAGGVGWVSDDLSRPLCEPDVTPVCVGGAPNVQRGGQRASEEEGRLLAAIPRPAAVAVPTPLPLPPRSAHSAMRPSGAMLLLLPSLGNGGERAASFSSLREEAESGDEDREVLDEDREALRSWRGWWCSLYADDDFL